MIPCHHPGRTLGGFLLVLTTSLSQGEPGASPPVDVAVAQAHSEIWRRFIDEHGIMLDFTDLDGSTNLPTPEECRDGKPNALGWWSPIENGAMFNGLYLDAAILRWEKTRSDDDLAKARRLMEGLLALNSTSEVKGFVARGFSSDGKSHYAMGSDDQTTPWLVGLWRYWRSGAATDEEKQRIERHLAETVEAILRLDWRMPAEPPFGTRGSFDGFDFNHAARQLFALRMMEDLTGDEKWARAYRNERDRRGGEENQSKLAACRGGMKFFYAKTHNWTSCTAVYALRGLWEMETDPEAKAAYAEGLAASARLAAESLELADHFDPEDPSEFRIDWRTSMLPLWKPQETPREAVDLASAQVRAFLKVSPRRKLETAYVREPTAAAWIVTLCPDPEVVRPHLAEIDAVIRRFDYSQLYYSTFFWVEGAWWRLRELRQLAD
ncbi:MAG: hypothetical protein KDN19_01170 [Verrucomicrobiae bacterium]|nr:hypothetical protein [Verrucomicrobiae bacterium]